MKKYKILPNDTMIFNGKKLYRVKALKKFGDIKKGTIGGYIEEYKNLSQDGNCWVGGNAIVMDDSMVLENAYVGRKSIVHGGSIVKGRAFVGGDSSVSEFSVIKGNSMINGHTKVFGKSVIVDSMIGGYAKIERSNVYSSKIDENSSIYGVKVTGARIYGNSKIQDEADFIVLKNLTTSKRTFTYCFTSDFWCIGCFKGNTSELKKELRYASELQKLEYGTVIKYVSEMRKVKEIRNGKKSLFSKVMEVLIKK